MFAAVSVIHAASLLLPSCNFSNIVFAKSTAKGVCQSLGDMFLGRFWDFVEAITLEAQMSFFLAQNAKQNICLQHKEINVKNHFIKHILHPCDQEMGLDHFSML